MRRLPIAVLAIVLATAACGGGDGTGSGTTTTTTQATATTDATATTEPTTTASDAASTTTLVSSGDPNVDAITTTFSVAFDSTSDYAAKSQYIDDPTGLEDTIATYMATGNSMGGIGVSVTNVVVNGDTADVTYDLLFNGNPVYPDQTGTAILTDEGWKVPRDVFCTLMAHARSSCPVN
jgi:hypothetical protein